MATWNRAVPSAVEQRELKKDALLRTAAFAFRTNGYHGSSLNDIAEKLGITKPTLYYYVRNKQDLLYQCHLAASEQALASICRDTGLDSLERLCRTMEAYVASMVSEESYSVIILEERSLHAAQLKEVIAARDSFEREIVAMIEAGVADGTIRSCEPKFAAFCVLGTANWVTKWYRPAGHWTVEEVAAGVGAFVRSALSPTAEGAGRGSGLFGMMPAGVEGTFRPPG